MPWLEGGAQGQQESAGVSEVGTGRGRQGLLDQMSYEKAWSEQGHFWVGLARGSSPRGEEAD